MRKFLPGILIIATMVGVLMPLTSFAATDLTANLQGKGISWKNCTFSIGDVAGTAGENAFDFTKCVAMISYNILYMPTAAVFWFSGQLLDLSMHYSINKTAFDSELIVSGWKACRDFVNLFFIFILLYIAIATILQLGGYGIKDLLVKVLIIALLVNFSLMICRVIIDASNILAWEFYNKASVKGGGVTTSVFGTDARDISAVFITGFDPEKLLSSDKFNAWKDETGGSSLVVLVLFSLGAIMNLVGTFVLFAGAVLFIIRIAVLWLIMMLAPLAFLAMALPKTKAYASQWWEKLFNQSFFAPAFLFLIYLVALLVGGRPQANPPVPGILETIFQDLGDNIANSSMGGVEKFLASLVTVFIHFIVMVVLMVGALIIAKQLGAYGGKMVMDWGKDARKWGQGYAGRIGKRYVGRAATSAQQGLDKDIEGTGKFAKTLRVVQGAARATPFLQRGLAAGAQLKKKEVGKYEKQYSGYDTRTLEQLRSKFGTTREAKEAMGKILTKRNVQEVKKEDVNKENARYEVIEKELPKMEEWNKADKTRKIELNVELEESSMAMQKKDISEAEKDVLKKKRYQILLEQEQVDERIKEVNQMREEKKKIEENRTRRREIEGLEERVAKAEAGIEGVAAKKPKEAGPEKT